MSAGALLNAAHFDTATDIVNRLETSEDPEELADLMDVVAQGGDLTHAVVYRLFCRLRGIPDETGLEVATAEPGPSSLILPPGVTR